MNMGKGSCAGSLDQRNVPISHVKSKIKKCLYDKIITARRKMTKSVKGIEVHRMRQIKGKKRVHP